MQIVQRERLHEAQPPRAQAIAAPMRTVANNAASARNSPWRTSLAPPPRSSLITPSTDIGTSPPASSRPASTYRVGSALRKPPISAAAPRVIAACTSPPVRIGRGTPPPMATGSTCSSAPHITCSMKPAVKAWVSASICGVQREARASPETASNRPARMPNADPLRKNRNGSCSGGVCSKFSPPFILPG